MRRAAFLLLWGLLAWGWVQADDVRVSARIEPSSGATDTRPIQLVIEASGENVGEVTVPKFPAMTNLRVLSGPSVSRGSSFTLSSSGATRKSSVTLVYTLMAQTTGEATIPPLSVRVGERIYRTEPIDFDVGSGPSGPRTRSPAEADDADVFLRATISADEVFVGQPVFLDVTLYAAVSIVNFAFADVPSLSSFWAEDVEVDANRDRSRVEIEGRPYIAYPVVRKILVPTAAGTAKIEPFTSRIDVRRGARDLFEDFFGRGSAATILRKSRPLSVRVKPLPAEGQPDDFGGAVGSFRLRAEADRDEAAVNDAVALTAVVEGTGFLQGVTPPRLESTPDLKVFEPKATESSRAQGGKLVSRRNWEWVVVPLAPGTIAVPRVRFSYFDPEAGTYRTLTAGPEPLTVRRGAPAEAPSVSGEVRAQRREIAFIKEGGAPPQRLSRGLHRRPGFVVLLVLPIAATPILIGVGRRRARLLGDRGFARARRAGARARRALAHAARHGASADTAAFHESVARALVGYVADRSDRSPAGLTYDVMDDLLAGRGADEETRRRFRNCLERCDFARYVPDSGSAERRDEVVTEARALLDALERLP